MFRLLTLSATEQMEFIAFCNVKTNRHPTTIGRRGASRGYRLRPLAHTPLIVLSEEPPRNSVFPTRDPLTQTRSAVAG